VTADSTSCAFRADVIATHHHLRGAQAAGTARSECPATTPPRPARSTARIPVGEDGTANKKLNQNSLPFCPAQGQDLNSMPRVPCGTAPCIEQQACPLKKLDPRQDSRTEVGPNSCRPARVIDCPTALPSFTETWVRKRIPRHAPPPHTGSSGRRCASTASTARSAFCRCSR